jgi:hypothetical protein
MMFRNCTFILCLQLFVGNIQAQMPTSPDSLRTPFEIGRGLQTATHTDGIAFYDKLSRTFPKFLRFETRGSTDCGIPLNLLVIADDAMRASPQYAAKKK